LVRTPNSPLWVLNFIGKSVLAESLWGAGGGGKSQGDACGCHGIRGFINFRPPIPATLKK
jgi:hypothetical protein